MCLSVGRGTVFKQEVASKGRQLLNESVDAIKMITSEMIQNSMEIPFADFRETTKALMEPNVGKDVVAQYVAGATGFWTYVFGIAKENRKILSQMRGEMLSAEKLYGEHNAAATMALQWIAKATERLVDALMISIEYATMKVACIIGGQLNTAYEMGDQVATETVLMAYTALLEVVISDPKENSFAVDVGIELSRSLKSVEMLDERQRAWLCNYMEAVPSVAVRAVLRGFNFASQLVMGVIFERFTSLMRNVFATADDMMDLKTIIGYATELSSNNAIPAANQVRLQTAIDHMKVQQTRMASKLDGKGVVSPWLVARVLRQFYYDQVPDQNAMKESIEQRFGSHAESIITGAMEARELLAIEIECALYEAGGDDNTTQRKQMQESIEGGADWWNSLFGKKKDEKKATLTPEQEEEVRRKHGDARVREMRAREDPDGVFDVPRNVMAIAKKRAELLEALATANAELEQQKAKYGQQVELMEALNVRSLVGATRAAQDAIDSGRERGTQSNYKLAHRKDQNAMLVSVIGNKIEIAQDAVDQIEYELKVLAKMHTSIGSQVISDSHWFTKFYFILIGIGMFFYLYYVFQDQIHAMTSGSWTIMYNRAEKYGVTPAVTFLEKTYRATVEPATIWIPQRVRDYFDSPSGATMNTLAGDVLNTLNRYRDTGQEAFDVLIDKYGGLVESLGITAKLPELRAASTAVSDMIRTASQDGATAIQRRDAVHGIAGLVKWTNMILSGSHAPQDFVDFATSFAAKTGTLVASIFSAIASKVSADPSQYVSIKGAFDMVASTASAEMLDAVKKQLMANSVIIMSYPYLIYFMVLGYAETTAMFTSRAYPTAELIKHGGLISVGTIAAIKPLVDGMFEHIGLAVEANMETQALAWFKVGTLLCIAAGCFGFGPALWFAQKFKGYWNGRRKTPAPQELPSPPPEKLPASGGGATRVTPLNSSNLAPLQLEYHRVQDVTARQIELALQQKQLDEEYERLEETKKNLERKNKQLELPRTTPRVDTPESDDETAIVVTVKKSGGGKKIDRTESHLMLCSQCNAPAAWNCNHCGGARKYCSDACFKKQWDNSKGTHL